MELVCTLVFENLCRILCVNFRVGGAPSSGWVEHPVQGEVVPICTTVIAAPVHLDPIY